MSLSSHSAPVHPQILIGEVAKRTMENFKIQRDMELRAMKAQHEAQMAMLRARLADEERRLKARHEAEMRRLLVHREAELSRMCVNELLDALSDEEEDLQQGNRRRLGL